MRSMGFVLSWFRRNGYDVMLVDGIIYLKLGTTKLLPTTRGKYEAFRLGMIKLSKELYELLDVKYGDSFSLDVWSTWLKVKFTWAIEDPEGLAFLIMVPNECEVKNQFSVDFVVSMNDTIRLPPYRIKAIESRWINEPPWARGVSWPFTFTCNEFNELITAIRRVGPITHMVTRGDGHGE